MGILELTERTEVANIQDAIGLLEVTMGGGGSQGVLELKDIVLLLLGLSNTTGVLG